MTRIELVIAALATGPKTNDELQDVLQTHSGDVARLMCRLRDRGLTDRTLYSGRALYYLRSGRSHRALAARQQALG